MKPWKVLCSILLVSAFSLSSAVFATTSISEPVSASSSPFEQALININADSWINNNQLTSQALDALDFIQSALTHGLKPEDYAFSTLQKLSINPEQHKTLFHRTLTQALIELIHDLAIGRLDPAIVDPKWHIPRDHIDEFAILLNAIQSSQLKNTLNKLTPQLNEYYQLMSTLTLYRSYVSRGGWQAVPDTPLLKPGATHQAIPAIRARLAVEEAVLSRQDSVDRIDYDPLLVEAVRRFQHRNGLKVDGIIGSETLTALNIPAEQRLKQIELNLERLRWLPNNMGDRYLLVNIASYQLRAVEHGQTELEMKVIVGRQKRQTPSFKSEMTHIVFNPYWNVPNKLARLDLLPKQKANPDYFFLHDFRVFLKSDPKQEVDPYLVDWENVSSRHFPYRLQQLPGTHNALGKMKFMFPNPWSIYLHDTPDHSLFEQHQRNFSSGCIRVEQPLNLAEFMLNDANSPEWLQQQIDSKQNRGHYLKEPLPVYAVYFTVWPSDDVILFSQDPYHRDQDMAKYL